MSIITLITDWQSADYYIGAIKGKILSQNSNLCVVDVNHQIKSYSVAMAAFVLKYSYSNFPKGTVHIVSVDSEPSVRKTVVAVKYDEHFFVSTDNGIFSLLIDDGIAEIVEIENNNACDSFPELNIFADVAVQIAEKKDIANLGKPKDKLLRLLQLRASVEPSRITGNILFIDSFGNAITNVQKSAFEKIRNNRDFKIYVQSTNNLITQINTSYNQSSEGELLAIFNSINYLEIAIRKGNLCQLMNLDMKTATITIIFEEPKQAEAGKLF